MKRFLLVISLLAIGAPVDTYSKQKTWWLIENGYFSVLTDEKPKKALKLVRRIEEFRVAAGQIVGVSIPSDVPKTRLVIFRTLKDFERYAPDNGVLGYMLRLENGPLVVIPARTPHRPGILDPMHIARHEYIHVLSSYHTATYPCWYEEGFAEVLATAKRDGKDIILGKPERDRTIGVYKTKLTNRLIETCKSGWGESNSYGKFWLLAHYLTFDADRQDLLIEYLNLFNDGMSSNDAFLYVFGMSAAELWEKELLDYRRIPTYRIPIDWSEIDGNFSVTEASQEQVVESMNLLEAWFGGK